MNWDNRSRDGRWADIAFVKAGEGRPVVFLHGVGLRAEAFAAQLAALADSHAVYLFDLPGHGESPAIGGEPVLADFTARVVKALERIDGPVFVVGHSMGAMIALDLAARNPQLCLGVVALNAIFRRPAQAAAAVRERAAELTADAPADPGPTIRRWFGSEVSSAEATACRRWLLGVDPAAYRAAYNVFAREDGPSIDALRALRCPALFATGSKEPNSTPEMSRRMAAYSRDGDALIIDGAAHMMPMTHAKPVNGALADFLGRCSGASR